MKFRAGFVTNSSSSSFVCCICKESYKIYNGEDEQNPFCESGHTMCIHHLNTEERKKFVDRVWPEIEADPDIYNLKEEDIQKIDLNYEYHDKLSFILEASRTEYEIMTLEPDECPVCSFRSALADDVVKFLEATGKIEISDVLNDMKKSCGGDYSKLPIKK